MKRLLALALLIFTLPAIAQTCVPVGGVQCTANFNMWLPPYAYPFWNVPVNANTKIIDAALASAPGKPAAPAFYLQGSNSTATAFTTDSLVNPFISAQITSSVNQVIYIMAPPYNAACDWNGTTGTDDTAAFYAAWAAIHTYPAGGKILLPPASCFVPNGLNWSTGVANYAATFTIQGQGKTSSYIVTKNAPIGIDFGGVDNVHLNDFQLTDVGTTAKVGIARYRSGNTGTGGAHIYRDLSIFGAYSLAALYSVQSENDYQTNVELTQTGTGAAYSQSSQNCLGLTGQGQPIAANNSDTVNHWIGGIISVAGSGGTGGDVLLCSGSTDNLTFDGTYFDAYSPATYQIRFGINPTDDQQGTKVFHNVRFEGNVDAISVAGRSVQSLTIDGGSVFGEISPAKDFNWTGPAITGYGLIYPDIENISTLGNGWVIPIISGGKVHIGSLYSLGDVPASTLTNSLLIEGADVQANAYAGSGAQVSSTVTTTSNDAPPYQKSYTAYGPNTPTSSYNQMGSTLVFRPFGTQPGTGPVPYTPLDGETAMADCNLWQPWPCNTETMTKYNAASGKWESLVQSANADFPVGGNLPVGGNIANSAGGLGINQNMIPCSSFSSSCMSANWTVQFGTSNLPTIVTGVENDIYGNPTVVSLTANGSSGMEVYPVPTISAGVPYTMYMRCRTPSAGVFTLGFGGGGGGAGIDQSFSATSTYQIYKISGTLSGSPIRQVFIETNSGTVYCQLPSFTATSQPLAPLYTTGTPIPQTLGLAVGGYLINTFGSLVLPASLVTTAATTDNVTVAGMTSSGHCTIGATNAAAATDLANTYISAKTTNQITVTHSATANENFDLLCTAN